MSRQDELGSELLKLIKRKINDDAEIYAACRALAEAHGQTVVVKLSIEAQVIRVDDDEEDDDEERIPYTGPATVSMTERDRRFLEALRIKPE